MRIHAFRYEMKFHISHFIRYGYISVVQLQIWDDDYKILKILEDFAGLVHR